MGFLFAQEGRKTSSAKKRPHIPVTSLRERSCQVCTLNKAPMHSPKLLPQGDKKPEIYLLTSGPDEVSDSDGDYFSGDHYDFFKSRFPNGYKVRIGGAVQCYSSKDVTEMEVQCCWNRVESDIEKSKPDLIFCLGITAFKRIVPDVLVTSAFHWRGRLVPVRIGKHTCWAMCLTDPNQINRIQRKLRYGTADEDRMFERDIANGLDLLEDSSKYRPEINIPTLEDVRCLYKLPEIIKALDSLSTAKEVGFDLETKNLRPYDKDSLISTFGIASADDCIAFPYKHQDAGWTPREFKKLKAAVQEFVEVGPMKIAHNLHMELEWSVYEFGDGAYEADWADSMAASYVSDTRKGTQSLAFQSLATLGYNIKALSPPLNMHAMDTEPLSDVLPYNGMDAIASLDVYNAYMDDMPKDLQPTYHRHIRRTPVFVASVAKGIPVRPEIMKRFKRNFSADIEQAKKDIQRSKQGRKFKKHFGRAFDPSSDADMHSLFKDLLDRSEIVVKRKNKNTNEMETKFSFDASVLQAMDDLEITEAILQLRNRSKLLSTYVEPFTKAPLLFPDGRLHPSVNDKYTETARTSWSDPNMQNWPSRKDAFVRAIIQAFPGKMFIAADYGQIEARVIAILSGDETYKHALWNDLDIHADWATRFLDMVPGYFDKFAKETGEDDEAKILKVVRNKTKNSWVFPSFFGASTKSRAGYMGIDEKYAEAADREFWSNEHFSGVKRWQNNLINEYNDHGHIRMLSGRRAYGPMTKNDIFNYGVQGFAGDIQKHAMCVCFESGYPIWVEIHDDLSFERDEEHLDEDVKTIAEIMACSPIDEFPEIDVPLTVEIKTGPNWADLKEYGEFSSEDFKHAGK